MITGIFAYTNVDGYKVIGDPLNRSNNYNLPWPRCKKDMEWYSWVIKEYTEPIRSCFVIGGATYMSLPKKNKNIGAFIVMDKNQSIKETPPDAIRTSDLDVIGDYLYNGKTVILEDFALLKEVLCNPQTFTLQALHKERAFLVLGGATVYKEVFPYVDRWFATKIVLSKAKKIEIFQQEYDNGEYIIQKDSDSLVILDERFELLHNENFFRADIIESALVFDENFETLTLTEYQRVNYAKPC